MKNKTTSKTVIHLEYEADGGVAVPASGPALATLPAAWKEAWVGGAGADALMPPDATDATTSPPEYNYELKLYKAESNPNLNLKILIFQQFQQFHSI